VERVVPLTLMLIGAVRANEASKGVFDGVVAGGRFVAVGAMALICVSALPAVADPDHATTRMTCGIGTVVGFGAFALAALQHSGQRVLATVMLFLAISVLTAWWAGRAPLHTWEDRSA